jgi:hypothetical protein
MNVITQPILGFDYASIDADLADLAKQTADRIRSRLTEGYLATGRDLIALKGHMEHGAFGAWLKAEFPGTARTAERYMRAADLAAVKSDIVSHLPPTIVHLLAAPSATPTIVAEVLAAAEAGTVMPAAEVRGRLADAVKADREAKIEAAKTPEQVQRRREAKKRRAAAEEAQNRKWQEERQAVEAREEAKAQVIAKYLVAHLGASGTLELCQLMAGLGWHKVDRLFRPLTIDEINAAFGTEAVR